MSLNKIYDSKFVQIYIETGGNYKKSERYEYIYRYLNNSENSKSENKDVQIYKSYQFPYNLLSISTGFIFVHPVGKEKPEIPILPDYEYKDYKTNLKCLSNGFINRKDINTVMRVRPSKNCHPNCINDYTTGLKINVNDDNNDDNDNNKNDNSKEELKILNSTNEKESEILKNNNINKNDIFKHFVEIQENFKNIKE